MHREGIKPSDYSVAYIDVRMPPGIDGVEAIRRIRQIETDVELVIMTAYTDKPLPEIVRDMKLLNKLLYIRKPFAPEEVQQITLSLVERWNVEQELTKYQRQIISTRQKLEIKNQNRSNRWLIPRAMPSDCSMTRGT